MQKLTPRTTPLLIALSTLLPAACRPDEEGNPPPCHIGTCTNGGTETPGGTGFPGDSGGTGSLTLNPTSGGSTSDSGTAADEGSGGIMPVDCPGHRLYQCGGYKVAVYRNVTTGVTTWTPPHPMLDPLMCFPSDGYTGPGHVGWAGYDHQQPPILVCAPDMEGDITDPTSPIGEALVASCTSACEARGLDPGSMPPNLGDYDSVPDGELWRRVYTHCEVGPGADRIVPAVDEDGNDIGGQGVECESLQGSPPAYATIADVGPCTNENDDTDCPVDELELCRSWAPELWVFSTSDRAGNPVSVVDLNFLASEVSLSTMFACDEQSYVYSADGTGSASIQGADALDFLPQLGLTNGDKDFEVRYEISAGWSAWQELNTFDGLTLALSQFEHDSPTKFELRYTSVQTGTRVTRTVEVKDCSVAGDSWRCDDRDAL